MKRQFHRRLVPFLQSRTEPSATAAALFLDRRPVDELRERFRPACSQQCTEASVLDPASEYLAVSTIIVSSSSKMTVRARSRGPRLIPLWPRATSERGGQSYTGVASSAPPAEPGPGSHFGGSRPAGRPLQVVREQKSRPNCGALPQIAGVEIDHSIEQRIPAFDPIAGSPIPPSFFTGTQCATASAGVTALFLVGSGLNVRAARRAVASLRYAV